MSTKKAARISTLFFGEEEGRVWYYCSLRSVIATGVLQGSAMIVTEKIQKLANKNLEEVLENLAKKSKKTQCFCIDGLKIIAPGISKRYRGNPRKKIFFLTSEKVFGNTLFVEIDGVLKMLSNSSKWRSIANKLNTPEKEYMIDVFEVYDLVQKKRNEMLCL